MKRFGGKGRIVGILVILASIVLFISMNQKKYEVNFHTYVEKWDNLYEGNNIHFYYINNNLVDITSLKEIYKIDEIVTEKATDLEATIAIDKWLKGKCEVALDVMDTNKSAKDTLENLIKNTTLSQRDYNRVMQELLAALGVRTRIGDLGTSKNYVILEVWDKEMNKWVAYDVMNGGYYVNEKGPLSGVDFVLGDLNSGNTALFNGEKKSLSEKQLKQIKQALDSYTIKIDNSLYEGTLINSLVTFVKDEKSINLETEKGYIKPTIFTKNPELFNGDPWKEYTDDQSDAVPTIIFAKKSIDKDEEGVIKFNLGAFMNSTMLEKYYVRVNGGEYEEVSTYYELAIKDGENAIEISLDGVSPIRSVVINKK